MGRRKLIVPISIRKVAVDHLPEGLRGKQHELALNSQRCENSSIHKHVFFYPSTCTACFGPDCYQSEVPQAEKPCSRLPIKHLPVFPIEAKSEWSLPRGQIFFKELLIWSVFQRRTQVYFTSATMDSMMVRGNRAEPWGETTIMREFLPDLPKYGRRGCQREAEDRMVVNYSTWQSLGLESLVWRD